jgi:hypothetical protein
MGGFVNNMLPMKKDQNLEGGGAGLGQVGVAGGNMGTPIPPNTMSPTSLPPQNLGEIGRPGGNMPTPTPPNIMGGPIGTDGRPLPPGQLLPPPSLGAPPGLGLPGAPGGNMNMLRKIMHGGGLGRVMGGPAMGGTTAINPTGGGNFGPGTTGGNMPNPMDSTVAPNMRRGGILGQPRPGQTPRARTNRGSGLSMF